MPIPAHAEIVVEGEIPPMERESLPGRTVWRTHRLLRHWTSERTGHQSPRGHASQRSDHSRRPAVKASAGNGSLRHSSAVGCRLVRFGISRRSGRSRGLAAWSFRHHHRHQAALRRSRSSSGRHRAGRARNFAALGQIHHLRRRRYRPIRSQGRVLGDHQPL